MLIITETQAQNPKHKDKLVYFRLHIGKSAKGGCGGIAGRNFASRRAADGRAYGFPATRAKQPTAPSWRAHPFQRNHAARALLFPYMREKVNKTRKGS
jgi:hypothetical protein